MSGAIYKTIVVGTDGSERAGRAVGQAIALAKATGASLNVVHVVHSAVSIGFSDTVSGQEGVQASRDEVDRIAAAVVADAEREGVAAEVYHPTGDPADALIEIAEKTGADLIVLGNRGMSGVARVLGSIPNKVAHHSPCSLLIVDTSKD